MPTNFEKMINWQIILFCFGIYIMTFILRRIVEGAFKRVTAWNWWDVLLHVFPPFLGVVVALAFTKYPYPDVIVAAGWQGRLFYGLGTGFFSGWGYKLFKGVVQKVTGVDLPDDPGDGGQPPVAKKPEAPPPAGG